MSLPSANKGCRGYRHAPEEAAGSQGWDVVAAAATRETRQQWQSWLGGGTAGSAEEGAEHQVVAAMS